MTTTAPTHEELLVVAQEVAQAAADVAMEYWRTGIGADSKINERDLVTIADKKADAAARAVIKKHFPDHGILTEEDENDNIQKEYVWTVDPIDGTVNYTMGLPTFGSIVGVMQNGEPIVGVCLFPALKEVYWGTAGNGSWMQRGKQEPTKLAVSTISSLEQVRFAACSGYLDKAHKKLVEDFLPKLMYSTNAARIHFAGAWDMMQLARGGEDFYLSVGDNPNVWDFAASVLIVREAGGDIHTVSGKPVTLQLEPDEDNPIGPVLVHNGHILPAAVEALQ